ncbi:MAG TPA: hypothetical protein VM575_15385 [Nocardioides sp.]|nr:hypothetical protein [Nocardioides sp.]
MDATTPWTEDRKQRIRIALRDRAEQEFRASRQAAAAQAGAARLDEDASHSVDDLSQSDEAGELSGLQDDAVARQARELAELDELDLAPREVAGPGAVVAFGGDHYLVGVVAAELEVDGVVIEGIAADAPVAAAIAGKRAGETFTVDGRELRLDLVV